jgi:hypothetical protein
MLGDACEHVCEIGMRVDAVQLAGADERVDRGRSFATRIWPVGKSYIDEAADFVSPRTRSPFRLDSSRISQREVRLAVPISTTPAQCSELGRAVVYAKQRGVSLVVDQIGRRR